MADSQSSSVFRNLCILHLQRLTLELKCPLCLKLLNNPVVFPCNHIFCKDCITMSEQNKQKCPTCQLQCLHHEIRSAPYMEGMVRLCQSLEETANAKAFQSSSPGKLPGQTPSTNICSNAKKEHPSEILRKRIYANSQSDGLVNNSKGDTNSKKLRPAAPEKVEQSQECGIIIDDKDANTMIKEEPHTEDCKVVEGNRQVDLKKLRPDACVEVEQSPDCVVISDDEDANTTIKEEPQTEDYKVAQGNSKYLDNQNSMAVERKDKVNRAMQLLSAYKKRRLANHALVIEPLLGPDAPISGHPVLNPPVVVSSQSSGAPNRQLRDESTNSLKSNDGFLEGDSLETRTTLKASGITIAGTSGGTSVVPKKLQGSERPSAPCTHGMGSKSLVDRIYEEEKATGKMSVLKILMQVNVKKDKDKQPTGEYYNLALQDAIFEYVSKFKERYGPEVDPVDYELEGDLWEATKAVSRGLPKGRVLGLGTKKQAQTFYGSAGLRQPSCLRQPSAG